MEAMSNKKSNDVRDQMLDRIGELFSASPEEIDVELKKEGIDIKKSLAALRQKLDVLQRRQVIQHAGAKRRALLQEIALGAVKAVAATRAEIELLLDSLKSSNPRAAQVYACRLEKATEADLESLKGDLEVVGKMKNASKRDD
jgi:hypothetical protein